MQAPLRPQRGFSFFRSGGRCAVPSARHQPKTDLRLGLRPDMQLQVTLKRSRKRKVQK
jgi:hypothetical protein